MPTRFITFLDYTEAEIVSLLNLADRLRDALQKKRLSPNLKGKSVALILDAEGFRNRAEMIQPL